MALVLPTTRFLPAPGSLIYFAPDGKTIETVTVAEGTAPAGTVLTDWEPMSCVDQATIEQVELQAGEKSSCWDATLGLWVPKKTRGRIMQLVLNFSTQDVTDYMLQMSVLAASINATTGAYDANSQPEGTYLGYIKFVQQAETEVQNTGLFRVELMLANPMPIASRSGVKPSFRANILADSDNAGALGVVEA